MKVNFLLLLTLGALLAGCQQDFDTSSPSSTDEQTVQGVICMKLDRTTAEAINPTRTRSGHILTGNISFDELCERYQVTDMERLFDDNGCSERTRKAGMDLWYTIRFEGTTSQVMAEFGQVPGVTYVETPRRITKIGRMQASSSSALRELSSAPKTVPANYPFNDPLFGDQWTLYNDATVNRQAMAGADVNILPAWEKSAGRAEVIVAIVDEGVQYTHPDLAANMWSGIGKNFCGDAGEDATITWGEGHGTHVAGAVAAVSNNNIGISGVAGGTGNDDGVKIMSCEIFHATNARYDAPSSQTAAAIKYAADNGAVICQNSWGYAAGAFSSESKWIAQERAVKEAIDYFITYAGMSADGETQVGPMAGGIVMFSSGNDNSSKAGYPAAYTPCISVSAISCNYQPAWYTNYGTTVDITAPGGGPWLYGPTTMAYSEGYNLSTLPTNLKNGDIFKYTNYLGQVESRSIDNVSDTPGYGYMQGTSMSCPHVSGVVALIVSHFGKPGFTNTQLKEILLSTTRNIEAETLGRKLGGLVDAGAALNYGGETPPPPQQPTITPASGQEDTFTMTTTEVKTLTYTLTNYTSWSLQDNSGKVDNSISNNVVTLTIDASKYAAGTYNVVLKVVNQSLIESLPINFTIEKSDVVDKQPTITPASGQKDTFTMTATEVKTLTYTLTDYTDWSLTDTSGKIEKSIAGNTVSLKIAATNYKAGSYSAELKAINGSATTKRTISYTITAAPDPDPDPTPGTITMDFYPNPCTDVLNVLADKSGEATLLIRNSVGMEVMNRNIVFVAGQPTKLDVSEFSSGAYLVDVVHGETSITRTIVKR